MLVASGGVLIFRKDFIAIYLIYIVNNSRHFYPGKNVKNPYIINQNHIFSKKYDKVISG
jgi:nitrogen fixation protein FixH